MNAPKHTLDIPLLLEEASTFAALESAHSEPELYRITDGKAVGTYLEHKFVRYLTDRYDFQLGNSASGIDFPGLRVDMKVTSVRQPQSSCPYKSARQKIYGLGYHLLIFVYDKVEDDENKASCLDMQHTIFVEQAHTADYQMTKGILDILRNEGNADDLVGFMRDRNLPVDDMEALAIAEDLLANPPGQGYLTISNALQWRLQYSRVIQQAGTVAGIHKIR